MAFINAIRAIDSKPIFINVNNIVAAFPSDEEGTTIQVTGQSGTGSLYCHEVEEPYKDIQGRINNALSSGL